MRQKILWIALPCALVIAFLSSCLKESNEPNYQVPTKVEGNSLAAQFIEGQYMVIYHDDADGSFQNEIT
jgi:hypothetical protein